MSSRDREMNVLALPVLAAGVLSFAIFHFLPGFGHRAGWKIWEELGGVLHSPQLLREPGLLATVACFIMATVLLVVSPFMMRVLRKSRLAWWLATTMSALSSIVLLLLVLVRSGAANVGVGGWFLLAAPLFNFAGLLMIRSSRSAAPGDGANIAA